MGTIFHFRFFFFFKPAAYNELRETVIATPLCSLSEQISYVSLSHANERVRQVCVNHGRWFRCTIRSVF